MIRLSRGRDGKVRSGYPDLNSEDGGMSGRQYSMRKCDPDYGQSVFSVRRMLVDSTGK